MSCAAPRPPHNDRWTRTLCGRFSAGAVIVEDVDVTCPRCWALLRQIGAVTGPSYRGARECPICGEQKANANAMQTHVGGGPCRKKLAANGGEYHDPIRARTVLAGISTAMHQAWGADWQPDT